MNQCVRCSVPMAPGQEKWIRHKKSGERMAFCYNCVATLKSKSKSISPEETSTPDWLRQIEVNNQTTEQAGLSSKVDPSEPQQKTLSQWLIRPTPFFFLAFILFMAYRLITDGVNSLINSKLLLAPFIYILIIWVTFIPGIYKNCKKRHEENAKMSDLPPMLQKHLPLIIQAYMPLLVTGWMLLVITVVLVLVANDYIVF